MNEGIHGVSCKHLRPGIAEDQSAIHVHGENHVFQVFNECLILLLGSTQCLFNAFALGIKQGVFQGHGGGRTQAGEQE